VAEIEVKKQRSQSVQKVTPILWFDRQDEESSAFNVNVFPQSKLIATA
jgi:predicted 3-demethylubiquinone-9 3-methyltransferase (glyoxalase superfamily)